MTARPRTERLKPLRLACWNADGVRGRRLELEHFLSQHGVEISLLSETFLNHEQPFRLANYFCRRKDTPTLKGGTAILVRRGSPSLSARCGPGPLRGYRHLSHFGRQTGDSRCGLPFTYPPTDRSGPVRLFQQGIAGLDGLRPQRQTRGLELEAEHETVETPTCLSR